MIDSHTHLFDHRFRTEDPPLTPQQLLRNAAEQGLTDVITIATTPSTWAEALDLASQQRAGQGAESGANSPRVWVAAGLHPNHVTEESVTEAQLITLAAHPCAVALGETGLDYHYLPATAVQTHINAQQTAFRAHLFAAQKTGLPVVVHTREAEADTLAILAEFPDVSFALHCFTGSRAMAEQAIAMGGYISFSGVLTFKKSNELREIASSLPDHRLMIETDAPYLAPEPQRGRRNQPSLLPHTAAALAAARSQSLAEIIQQTCENTRRFFPKMSIPA